MRADGPLLEVTDLVKHFPIASGVMRGREIGRVRAVDGVSLAIGEGESLGLVGESGCGKSTLCRTVLGLVEPTSGSVRFDGRELAAASRRRPPAIRRQMQMVFQDPYASLNPRKRVSQIVGDPLTIHGVATGAERDRVVGEALDRVGLAPAHGDRYPHEFSGGERQRIGIARALALDPRLIVADEPVSALDVSIQAQVVNLLEDLRDELGLAYLLVGHDLGVVRQACDRIAVMYLGKVVEVGPADAVCSTPIHPYTRSLVSATPIPDPGLRGRGDRVVAEGDAPSAASPPPACRFHPRCPRATGLCAELEPQLVGHDDGRFAACHHPLTGSAASD